MAGGRVVGTLGKKLLDGIVTLSTTVSQLTPAQQSALQSAAADLGLSYNATGTTTLRVLIQGMGEQHINTPYVISGAGMSLSTFNTPIAKAVITIMKIIAPTTCFMGVPPPYRRYRKVMGLVVCSIVT